MSRQDENVVVRSRVKICDAADATDHNATKKKHANKYDDYGSGFHGLQNFGKHTIKVFLLPYKNKTAATKKGGCSAGW